MNQRQRANAIALVALSNALGCASQPPPAPKTPVEEEAFVLDSKDPNAASSATGKSANNKKNKKGDKSATSFDDEMTGNRGVAHDVGSGLGSAPDHFGRARIGDSRSSLESQGPPSSEYEGSSSITPTGTSTYHGIPLDFLSYSFQDKKLLDIHFSSRGANCKKLLAALVREYGTNQSRDQEYTTETHEYSWRASTSSLDFQISPDGKCSGNVSDDTRTRFAH